MDSLKVIGAEFGFAENTDYNQLFSPAPAGERTRPRTQAQPAEPEVAKDVAQLVQHPDYATLFTPEPGGEHVRLHVYYKK